MIAALESEEDSSLIECYFVRIDSDNIIKESTLLKIVETDDINDDVKKQCLIRMRDKKTLRDVIASEKIQVKYKYIAIDQYVMRGGIIKELLNLNILGELLQNIIGRISERDLKDLDSQNILITAFEKEIDSNYAMSILKRIDSNQNLDTPKQQRKIASLLKVNQSDEFKAIVSRFLADGEVIVDLAIGKYIENRHVSLFAVGLAANDLWLEKIVKESTDDIIRSYAISRIDSEKIILPFLMSPDESTNVRIMAMRNLGSVPIEDLKRLTQDSNEIIAGIASCITNGSTCNAESLKKSIELSNKKIKEEIDVYSKSCIESEKAILEKFEIEERVIEAKFNEECEQLDRLALNELKPEFEQIDSEMRKFRFGNFGEKVWEAVVVDKISHWFSDDELELVVKGPYGLSQHTRVSVSNLDHYQRGESLKVKGHGDRVGLH